MIKYLNSRNHFCCRFDFFDIWGPKTPKSKFLKHQLNYISIFVSLLTIVKPRMRLEDQSGQVKLELLFSPNFFYSCFKTLWKFSETVYSHSNFLKLYNNLMYNLSYMVNKPKNTIYSFRILRAAFGNRRSIVRISEFLEPSGFFSEQ